MSKNLYNFVSSISGYEEIKEKCNVDIHDVDITSCKPSILKEGCGDQDFYRNYLIAENYLTYLRSNVNARIVENACKYFSYWVYKEMIMEKSYSYSVPELHDIIRQSKNIHICQDYVHNITPEIYLNIKKLIDLHNNFMEVLGGTNSFDCDKAEKLFNLYNGLINTCYLNSDDPFCNGIETIRNGYNKTLINAKDCAPYNFLQPFQKRPEKSANTIATAAITAISFASIMTYKFTPLGSWVRHRLSGNKNLRNKLEKEFTAPQNSSELQDMEYRVPYNPS